MPVGKHFREVTREIFHCCKKKLLNWSNSKHFHFSPRFPAKTILRSFGPHFYAD